VSAGGSLSPRGDWRAPSDLSARIWLDEVRSIPEHGASDTLRGDGVVGDRISAGDRR
jgi:hypothetical protein